MNPQLRKYLIDRKFLISDSELEEVEKKFEAEPADRETSFYYNEFRIVNAGRHHKKRPQILTAGIFNPNIPNVHTDPLIRFGDVVFLAAAFEPFPYKSVINCHHATHFFHILEQLPEGFFPDFYWDNQVEKDHFIPKGIEMAPFPTVASVCHLYYHLTIENICSLFDLVLPLSKLHCQQLEKKFPGKILEIPFGLNWASFDFCILPNFEKTIDVAVTFGPRMDPANKDRRKNVIQMVKEFQNKYNHRFTFVYAHDLPVSEYTELLQKSLIVINVAGVHGPYNYRTIEALCSGSLIFECNWSDGFYTNSFSELFQDGVHGVSFTFDNFEDKLLYYLTHKEEALQIAKQGLEFLKANYSYGQLFERLYQQVKKISVPKPRNFPKGLGYFYGDMIYYYQASETLQKMLSMGSIQISEEEVPWIQANNQMVLLTLPKETIGSLFTISLLTDLLNEKQSGDPFVIVNALYQKALKTAPLDQRWLIEWNYFLQCVKLEKAAPEQTQAIKNLLSQEVDPIADRLIFKYSIDEEDNSNYYDLYFEMNLNILKKIDQPKERANLFRLYALDYLTLLESK